MVAVSDRRPSSTKAALKGARTTSGQTARTAGSSDEATHTVSALQKRYRLPWVTKRRRARPRQRTRRAARIRPAPAGPPARRLEPPFRTSRSRPRRSPELAPEIVPAPVSSLLRDRPGGTNDRMHLLWCRRTVNLVDTGVSGAGLGERGRAGAAGDRVDPRPASEPARWQAANTAPPATSETVALQIRSTSVAHSYEQPTVHAKNRQRRFSALGSAHRLRPRTRTAKLGSSRCPRAIPIPGMIPASVRLPACARIGPGNAAQAPLPASTRGLVPDARSLPGVIVTEGRTNLRTASLGIKRDAAALRFIDRAPRRVLVEDDREALAERLRCSSDLLRRCGILSRWCAVRNRHRGGPYATLDQRDPRPRPPLRNLPALLRKQLHDFR